MSLDKAEQPLSKKVLVKRSAVSSSPPRKEFVGTTTAGTSSSGSSATAGSSSRMQAATTTTTNGSRSMTAMGTEMTMIEVKQMRFLIMDAPRQTNLHQYIKKMKKHHVTDVVRVCEPTYHGKELSSAGIDLHEMEYKDGTSPSDELIGTWLDLVEKRFYKNSPAESNSCIAVHCVAGLGRAPQMVAIALIEYANMDPVEAVSLIRSKRRGAINEKQLFYLESYKKRRGGGAQSACCVIL